MRGLHVLAASVLAATAVLSMASGGAANGAQGSRSLATRSHLTAVSCATPTSCLGLGSIAKAYEPQLVDSFDGRAWHVEQVIPNTLHISTFLQSVDCVTATWCMVVGYHVAPHTASHSAFSEVWTGKGFRRYVTANATGGNFVSVSCPSERDCVAVGTRSVKLDIDEPMAQTWNGSTWNLMPMPMNQHQRELHSVSCPTANFCAAVGSASINLRPVLFGELWNGISWRVFDAKPVAQVTIPCFGLREGCPGKADPGFNRVSCARSMCVAVGTYGLAEKWNGHGWTELPSFGHGVILYDVDCVGRSKCLAVGVRGALKELPEPAAYEWTGAAWRSVSPRVVPAISHGQFSELSCPSPTSCIALGASRYMAQRGGDGSTGYLQSGPDVAGIWLDGHWHYVVTAWP